MSGDGAVSDEAVSTQDREWESVILRMLAERARTSSICPSDAARDAGGTGWRRSMEDVRRAARRLMAAGEVEITQGGSVVPDPTSVRGPIRIRRPRRD